MIKSREEIETPLTFNDLLDILMFLFRSTCIQLKIRHIIDAWLKEKLDCWSFYQFNQ